MITNCFKSKLKIFVALWFFVFLSLPGIIIVNSQDQKENTKKENTEKVAKEATDQPKPKEEDANKTKPVIAKEPAKEPTVSAEDFWEAANGSMGNLEKIIKGPPQANKWVSAIAFNKSGDIFISARDGIWRSMDHCKTWEHILDRPWGGFNLGISPSGDIFVGGGDGKPKGGYVVWHSTDNGKTWTESGDLPKLHRGGSFSFSKSGKAFWATGWSWRLSGLLYSTNSGVNWERAPADENITWPNEANKAKARPSTGEDSGTVVLGNGVSPKGHIFIGTEGDGGYRSTDEGKSWTHIGLMGGNLIGFTFDSSGHVYAAKGGTGRGIHVSSDDGDTWKQLPINLPVLTLTVTPKGNFYIIVSGANGGMFFKKEFQGIHRSIDGGQTWTVINGGLLSVDVRSLALGPDGYLYTGTAPAGLFRSKKPVE